MRKVDRKKIEKNWCLVRKNGNYKLRILDLFRFFSTLNFESFEFWKIDHNHN